MRWFCHVDDDTYLNVVALVKLLRQYPHYEDWYIGKPSISKPLTSRIRPYSQVHNADNTRLIRIIIGAVFFRGQKVEN